MNLFLKLKQSRRLSQFLILFSFLLTFVLVRIITHLQLAGYLPVQNGDFHVHHLVPGIFLILLSGYLGISFWRDDAFRRIMAILFGIGAALTIDEFALWLRLRDVYWLEEGRESIDAVIVTGVLLTMALILSEAHDHQWISYFGFKKSRT